MTNVEIYGENSKGGFSSVSQINKLKLFACTLTQPEGENAAEYI